MKKFREFLNSEFFMLSIYLLGFLIWFFEFSTLLSVTLIFLVINVIIFSKSGTKSLVPLLFITVTSNVPGDLVYMTSVDDIFKDINMLISLLILVLAVIELIIYFLINRRKNAKPKFWIGFVLIVISFILSGTRQADTIIFTDYFSDSLFFMIAILIYLLFALTTVNEDSRYLSKAFLYLGVYISVQTFVWYIYYFDINALEVLRPSLKWGSGNAGALIMLLAMPLGGYLYLKKNNIIYFFLTRLCLIAIFLSTSRGAILCSIPLLIAIDIVVYLKVEDKLKYKTHYSGTIAFILMLIVANYTLVESMVENVVIRFFTQTGSLNEYSSNRIFLYDEAIKIFFNHPVLGIGTAFSPLVTPEMIWNPWYHNTFLDVMVSLGVVGLIAFIFHYYQKYKFFIKNRKDLFVLFGYLGIIGSGLYGLIDVTYFNYIWLFIFMIMSGVLEGVVDSK